MENKISEFQQIFESKKEAILNMKGCQYLSLHQDASDPSTMFTVSHWDSVDDLNQYRKSSFFGPTWKATKSLFREKAEAWSLVQISESI